MPEPVQISAIQRVKLPDGNYAIVYPINTVDDVFLNTDRKVSLNQALDIKKTVIDCGTSVVTDVNNEEDGGNADSIYSMHFTIDGGSSLF